ncbi:tRNA (adenosine(37)-N6)-dimethylallyltransferase MiaA [filamentous cyanobacterium CCP1]|nr:tRNA (adenosine(37)-N6)-dimethylallyltransferase MiaA [filamentous cyanobacterium CCP2]PSB64873.1 tRNA (adenosine(37)-N6)-dimethylallyltransferase MiaA [filamentous cyanobacterium CCP1]
MLIVICGATATGKSGLAIVLAQKLQSVILSADSRQVYREFNIGTAKPTWSDRQQIPHYLIDICDPTETLTLADYQQQAQELIEQIMGSREWGVGSRAEPQRTGGVDWTETAQSPDWAISYPSPIPCTDEKFHASTPLPLLVGGTGLYIKSIVRGLRIPRVAPQPELRSQLQGMGQSYCYALLQQVDAAAVQKIHPNDQVRTLRALEVFYVTGRPISQQQGECPPKYPILQIGLDGSPDALAQRIKKRTAQMIADGFVEEVEQLCQKYGADLPLLNTLGYQEIKHFLAGKVSLPEAEASIVLHTRQFAKQQRTWFRADPTIEWFDADAPDLVEQVWNRIQAVVEVERARNRG